MQRLYVGGLSHSITQKDLRDRFNKFGVVEDVELRTRRDEDGNPYKTFSYININISDADLQRCLRVLNNSKWKGGTLHIETAKESFLHRLAKERQTLAEQRLQQHEAEDKRQKMLDSMSRSGVDNFIMKAAVPGTVVPGHEDWVVGKFGLVLPVLQLSCRKGKRVGTMKYDPSKYSHNIRRLDRSSTDQHTPVTQLTWEVQGGDDDISKKRRGEFPSYETPRPKKIRTEAVRSDTTEGGTRFKPTPDPIPHTDTHQLRGRAATDGNVDSDEDVCRTADAQERACVSVEQEVEQDELEVVGLDYLLKSHRQIKGRPDDEDENDYDSADTDELLTSRKPPPALLQERPSPPASECVSTNRKRKTKGNAREEEKETSSVEDDLTSRKPVTTKRRGPTMAAPPLSESDEEESGSDSDYEAMFSNVTHLEISLADLQRLAGESPPTTPMQTSSVSSGPAGRPKKGTTPEEILAALMRDDSSEDERHYKRKRKVVASTPLPVFQGTRALNEETETKEHQRDHKGEEEEQKLNCDSPVKQTAESSEEEEQDEEEDDNEEKVEEEEDVAPQTVPTQDARKTEEMETKREEGMKMKINQSILHPDDTAAASPSSSHVSTEEDNDELEQVSSKDAVNAAQTPAHGNESSPSEEEEEEEELAPLRVSLGREEEEERQRKANVRRLAAVQQRQKEAAEHKKLIQGALTRLDAPPVRAGKHIKFGDDDDDDDDDKLQTNSKITTSRGALCEGSQSEDTPAASKKKGKEKSAPQLFNGSEDEEDSDEEEDGSRFDIRPQFEGPAGQKLIELQSRFGADERFRMDARFLDEQEDKEESGEAVGGERTGATEECEALEDERKKNLSILQSVLNSAPRTGSSKPASKAKTFRDVSALHYDPSREEHAAFETKTTEPKKRRSTRREEAQKVPEVSKEIYYHVSGDLKAVFGQAKEDGAGGEDRTSWDKEDEEEGGQEGVANEPSTQIASLLSDDLDTLKEKSCGFKFSFFGEDAETGSKEADYEAESIQMPKVSWQQDPRFHDSSSDEDDEEQEEDKKQSILMTTTREETSSVTDRFFFLYPDDHRLTDGPRLFCRSSHLEEQREQWEERRSLLRQECRKKHKDARRKLKSSHKEDYGK
ncbi:nucleolar protein 8 [Antennarius striatus]|uniref:nucleolar protein 8 n=1 Tax=Antennarius striatus TaxID=241820 RepID=UPI0035AE1EFA